MSEQGGEQDSPSIMSTSSADAVDAGVAAILMGGMEGDADKSVDASTFPANCLNCGALLHGRFCVDCGQDGATHVPTLAELIGDYLTGLFNLDSRIWRTMGALLFKPGKLTQEYLAGRRARYIQPLRLYIAMSILFFLVAALPERGGEPGGADSLEGAIQGFAEPKTDEEIRQMVLQQVPAEQGQQALEELDAGLAEAAAARLAAEDDPNADPPCTLDMPIDSLEARVRQACLDGQADDYAGFKRAFQDNMALMAFLVIPVMAVVFKLFYFFSGRGYLEHLAFLCHTHAFTLFLFAFIDVFAEVGNFVPWLLWPTGFVLTVLAVVYLPAYYYVALRRVYGQGGLLTLVKLLPLFLIYVGVTTFVFSVGMLILAFSV